MALVAWLLPGAALAEVIVGFAVALTGSTRPFDERQVAAARLAIDDLNEAGGLLGQPIRAVLADTGSRPNFAHRAVDELIAAGAALIVLTCDVDMRGTAAPRANERGVIAISPCAMIATTARPRVFSMASPPAAEAAALAAFAWERGWRRAQLSIDVSFVYNQLLCDRFAGRWRAMGGEIAAVKFGDARRGPLASEVDERAEVVVMCMHGAAAIEALRAMRAGSSLPVLAGAALDGDYWHDQVPGLSAFFHTASGSIHGDDPRPAVNAFFARWAARQGSPAPNSIVLAGYSAIEALARAAERAGTLEVAAVLAELDRFEAEPLLIGPTGFAPDSHFAETRPLVVIEVRAGKPRALGLYPTGE